jgi:GAG-pre-integrase domain
MWHNRLAHMPMRRIQQLAANGILPNRLARCNDPMCPACVFGKMTCKPWHTKQPPVSITPSNVKPGQFVSVDQLQSNVPGLMAQMKGTPTRHRFTIATVYVDHASDFTYVYLQKDSSQLKL